MIETRVGILVRKAQEQHESRVKIAEDLNQAIEQRKLIQENLKRALLPDIYLKMLHLMVGAEIANQSKLDSKIA